MSMIDTAVSEAFKMFGRFIYRDTIYIFAGVSVLISIKYCFDIPLEVSCISHNLPTLIYFCGLGYIVGYALQESFSITGFITTAYYKLGPISLRFAKRFDPTEAWDKLPKPSEIQNDVLMNCVDQHAPVETKEQIERTINLVQLTASGGSFYVVATFLFMGYFINHVYNYWYLCLSATSFALSLILSLINRIKSAEKLMRRLNINEKCFLCPRARKT